MVNSLADRFQGKVEMPAWPILVCADDGRSDVVTTANLYIDLDKQGVSSEMHIYASGGHGFSMRDSKLPVSTWPA